jgi:hypothetical protein
VVLRQARQGPQGFSSDAHDLARCDSPNRIGPGVLLARRGHLVVQFLIHFIFLVFLFRKKRNPLLTLSSTHTPAAAGGAATAPSALTAQVAALSSYFFFGFTQMIIQ